MSDRNELAVHIRAMRVQQPANHWEQGWNAALAAVLGSMGQAVENAAERSAPLVELAANYGRTRAHYSTDLGPRGPGSPGRVGYALCSTAANPVAVYDARAHAAWTEQFNLASKSLTELPLCKKCERVEAKLAAGDTGSVTS